VSIAPSAQRAYAAGIPAISVPNEVINQWEDWVQNQDLSDFGPPVFTPEEVAALAAFGRTWARVADATEKHLSRGRMVDREDERCRCEGI
jgi:hypothetical protein